MTSIESLNNQGASLSILFSAPHTTSATPNLDVTHKLCVVWFKHVLRFHDYPHAEQATASILRSRSSPDIHIRLINGIDLPLKRFHHMCRLMKFTFDHLDVMLASGFDGRFEEVWAS